MANENLAVIPNDWGQYKIFGDVKYDGDPQITQIDPNVLHNGHVSIRIDAHQEGVDPNHWREINWAQASTYVIPVKPGDHIVFKAWVKTGHSTLGDDGRYGNGGLIAFDYYGANGVRLHEHSSDNPRNDVESYYTWSTCHDDPTVYVPFNSDWTLRTLDIIVPSQVVDDQTIVDATHFSMGTPTSIIPILTASGYIVGPNHLQDEGQVWFADAELYINPTPTPSASVAARVPCFGNRALVQVYLRKLRDRMFSRKMREKLHPLI